MRRVHFVSLCASQLLVRLTTPYHLGDYPHSTGTGSVSTKHRVNDVKTRVPLRRLKWYQVVPSGTEGGVQPYLTHHLASRGRRTHRDLGRVVGGPPLVWTAHFRIRQYKGNALG